MNISQRKLMSGYNRATASDHRRELDDDQGAENMALIGICAVMILLAALKLCGIL